MHGASALFGLAVKARKLGFDKGLIPVHRISGVTVISVGNLRAGGSGKTPFSMYLSQMFQDRGEKTALLLRGYKGRMEARGGLVSNGDGPLVNACEAGDEAFMAAHRLQGVQVHVGSDRVASAKRAKEGGARVLVLDDGFQHRRLKRNLEILLTCPEDLHPNTKLLPAGPLREPPSSLSRGDLICGLVSDWKGKSSPPEILFKYVPSCFVYAEPGRKPQQIPLDKFREQPIYLVSGIARPNRFANTADAAGLKISGHSVFGDHHRFRAKDLRTIRSSANATGATAIVTTEKDLVRMGDLKSNLPLLALRVEVKLESGQSCLLRHVDSLL